MTTSPSSGRARELLGRYVESCPVFWASQADQHQCMKLWRQLGLIEEAFGYGRAEALDRVVAFAVARAPDPPSTVYVGGRGGSGSHWLAEMLGDLDPFADAGEVSVPSSVQRELDPWPLEEQRLFVDCLHLLHAWSGSPYAQVRSVVGPRADLTHVHVVNSNGNSDIFRAKRWEPGCVFVHLIRDPRDQVLSFTHRKPGAHENYPVEPLEDFLRLMLIYNRDSVSQVLASRISPDLVCRYEDLRGGAAPTLRRIADIAGEEIDAAAIDEVAFRHSAEARRQGLAPLGNLSPTPSKGWRSSATDQERLLMHAGLVEVVDTLGYDLDDCSGHALEFAPVSGSFEVEVPPGVVLGELHLRTSADTGWVRAGEAAGSFVVPAGSMARVRAPGGWTAGLARLCELLPSGCIASLCLGGNTDVDDPAVALLSGRRGLLELDLARTRVTDRCIGSIASIPDLAHVSLVGTTVTDDGVESLRTALPACQVSAAPLITAAMRGRRLFNEELYAEPPR